MSQTLYILQGVPGSGKSTLAEAIANKTRAVICSTDTYFTNPATGEYVFESGKLSEYHRKNLLDAAFCLSDLKVSVIVDNTNIKRAHVKPYVEAAVKLGIPVVFIRVAGPFESTHNVPKETIERMRREMDELTLESVLAS